MEVKQVIAVRKDLNMRKGKLAAQVAHASMISVLDRTARKNGMWILDSSTHSPMQKWLKGKFTKVVVGVDSEEELQQLSLLAKDHGIQVSTVTDSGATEFHGIPTVTCMAFGPDEAEKLDLVTGNLKLL